ncbi:MAG: NifX-associated nitrogen fixation protein [Synechococcales bacterium]|nr:NifX-associated nitrogen fixation protein [Synechococcales bacterium]
MTAAEPIIQAAGGSELPPLLRAIVQQIRANDPYGTYRNWKDELLLKPYVLTRAQKREISVDGDVDPITKSRVMCFYRAIASRIEEETGLLSQVVIDLSHEGFGWALVFSGRLLLVSRTLRDAQRFGFDTLEKLNEEGEKLVQKAVVLSGRFPDVGRL